MDLTSHPWPVTSARSWRSYIWSVHGTRADGGSIRTPIPALHASAGGGRSYVPIPISGTRPRSSCARPRVWSIARTAANFTPLSTGATTLSEVGTSHRTTKVFRSQHFRKRLSWRHHRAAISLAYWDAGTRLRGWRTWEVRTTIDKLVFRVLFCLHREKVILLHAFIKKARTTPKADLDLAKARRKDLK